MLRQEEQDRLFKADRSGGNGINWRARVPSTTGNHYLAPHCHVQMWIWDCKGEGCFSA